MASTNASVNNNLVTNAKNSDTLSEISEGTATSGLNSNWSSREELRDFVTRHGLKDLSDLYQERFRVDRNKLEQMLSGHNDALAPADVFFAKIMEDTDTFITWPNKLKLGAKSKKDPHVRIAGRPEDVRAAKSRIVSILYTRCNRVTMKMDISYTDHSHIIGKGGLSIKRVMEETQCHVHFPDSNRSNPTEKSNQVSISGEVEGVENARSRVRQLVPLIFGFEPPIMGKDIDGTHPFVNEIQEQFKVQVMFKTRSKLHATIVLVKGVEWEVEQVKQATMRLMDFLCENLASQIAVQMSLQISPQHHQAVLGKNHANLKAIMQYTKCQILFPDAQDANIPSLKKSNVNISGNIHGVYTARQLLIGSLPLLIIFDLPEETEGLRMRPEDIAEIQNACDVNINIRQKTKQVVKACVIKGVEKYAASVYRARSLLLGLGESHVVADIPRTYHMPSSPTPPTDSLPTPTIAPHSPLLSPLFPWHYQSVMSAPANAPPIPTPTQSFQFSYLSPPVATAFHSDSSFLSSISSGSSYQSPASKVSPPSATSDYQSLSERRPDSMYEAKRLAGIKAMHAKPTGDMCRVPTGAWSGYGISHTSPAALKRATNEEEVWASPQAAASNHNTSNILDHTPVHFLNNVTASNWADLPSLLASLGLERYVGLFVRHEVDLATFATLNEKDLMVIGVSAFGSRRKMVLAISELNKRSGSFSVAPGAERKSSSSNSPLSYDGRDTNW